MSDETCKLSRWQVLKSQLNNLCPESFKKAVAKDPGAIIFDVRTFEEFRQGGSLFDAENLDYLGTAFLDRLDTLDRQKNYYVYCRTGRRSIRVCTLMKNSGFRRVYNMDGGLNEWERVFP